jgi:NADH:ubiquinone oxidoreductase subunit B-like Fe-S oxidoreductase
MLWEQIPEPKWSMAMGECATSGGKYYQSYAIIGGADEVIPIDVYIPGCPVRPEALMFAVSKLMEKIERDAVGEWVPPSVPDYVDYNDQVRDLIAGKNEPWKGNMVYEEVQDIPAMGALTNVEVPDKKKKVEEAAAE